MRDRMKALQREQDAFDQRVAELLVEHQGEFLVFHEGAPVGFFETYNEAYPSWHRPSGFRRSLLDSKSGREEARSVWIPPCLTAANNFHGWRTGPARLRALDDSYAHRSDRGGIDENDNPINGRQAHLALISLGRWAGVEGSLKSHRLRSGGIQMPSSRFRSSAVTESFFSR